MAESHKEILVYLARHGTTTLNSEGCFRGNKDVPLDESGTRDAHKLAFYLAPIEICLIVSSDKKRAIQTAKIIAQQKDGLEIHQSENLEALNVGDFSGQPKNKENLDLLQYYIENPNVPIPGGESLNSFKNRVRPCLKEAIDIAQERQVPVLIVAHSSTVHEVGDVLYGDHKEVLVEPGGLVAIYSEGGKLKAEAIFKATPDENKGPKISHVS